MNPTKQADDVQEVMDALQRDMADYAEQHLLGRQRKAGALDATTEQIREVAERGGMTDIHAEAHYVWVCGFPYEPEVPMPPVGEDVELSDGTWAEVLTEPDSEDRIAVRAFDSGRNEITERSELNLRERRCCDWQVHEPIRFWRQPITVLKMLLTGGVGRCPLHGKPLEPTITARVEGQVERPGSVIVQFVKVAD